MDDRDTMYLAGATVLHLFVLALFDRWVFPFPIVFTSKLLDKMLLVNVNAEIFRGLGHFHLGAHDGV